LAVVALLIVTVIPVMGKGDDPEHMSENVAAGSTSFSVPVDLTFDVSGVEVINAQGYCWYYHPEGSISPIPGEPALPVFYYDFMVHPYAFDIRFELLSSTVSIHPVDIPVMGVPEPAAYSEPSDIAPSGPTRPVDIPVTYLSEGLIRGVKVASLRFDPMLLTTGGLLIVHEEVHGKLTFEVDNDNVHDTVVPVLRETSVFREMFETGLMNPQDLSRFGAMRSMVPFAPIQTEDVQYVVITDKTKTGTSFKALVDWKVQKGVPSKIVDTSMIYANYTGVDNAEKVRKFIMDAKNIWGTEFVLIGGDTGVIPVRKVYNSANGYSSSADPTDLYYSDLDGTWNGDGDSTWGETSDGVDMRPDVIVGRAPVQSVAEANTFVTKALKYEKDPTKGYLDNATLAGEFLDSSTNSSRGLDNIKTNLLTSNFKSTSMYDRSNGVYGNLNKPNFMAQINKGASLIFHAGHSNWNVMSVGSCSNSDLYNGDIKNYNGGYKVGVISSVGCIANKFDQDDCIAELHVMEADGGTIAYIGNSNYGWYSPGNPGGGPSDVFQYRIAYELFKNGKNRVGTHFAEGKNYYAGSSSSYNSYRWIEMCLNLIGDPEMFVRTAEPILPNLTLPERIGLDTTDIDITVKDSMGRPVKGSLLCLEQDGKRTYNQTNAQGLSRLALPIVGKSYLNLTVTGQNFLPYITNISLDTILPSIVLNGPFAASTGDISQFNCSLYDEYGISNAIVEYYTNTSGFNSSGSVQLTDSNGFWTGDVRALWNSTEPMVFRIAARDGSGNWNRTDWTQLEVIDDDRPFMVSDLTSAEGRTGDMHDIVMVVNDNIGVKEVLLKVGWKEEAPFWTGEMDLTGDSVFRYSFDVPSGRDGTLVYEAFMTDASGNDNRSGLGYMTVLDDDPPIFLEDLSDTAGTTSDEVSLRVRALDNIAIFEVKVDYWSPVKGFIGSGTMVKDDGGVWSHAFLAPSDLIGGIEHRFSVMDLTGNKNLSKTATTVITDDDIPVVLPDQIPPQVTTGEPLTVKATVLDNVGVRSVDLVISYGSLRSERVGMALDDGSRYVALVQVPSGGSGELTFLIEAFDSSGNSNSSAASTSTIIDNDPPRVLSIRTMSSVNAGGILDVYIEARDNIGLEKGVLTWYLSGDGYRRDIEMDLADDMFTTSIEVDQKAYGYIYWTSEITDGAGNFVTTKKIEVRIVPPLVLPDPIDDEPETPRVPVRGEDLDNDGMDDLWEHANGLDISSDDSEGDPDGDGAINLEEFQKGTAPRDALHYPVKAEEIGADHEDRDISYIIIISGAAVLLLLLFVAALLLTRRV
jgi:hypothetical protein